MKRQDKCVNLLPDLLKAVWLSSAKSIAKTTLSNTRESKPRDQKQSNTNNANKITTPSKERMMEQGAETGAKQNQKPAWAHGASPWEQDICFIEQKKKILRKIIKRINFQILPSVWEYHLIKHIWTDQNTQLLTSSSHDLICFCYHLSFPKST